MRKLEHNLQAACVRWFDLQFPHLAKLLFAIPNGGKRNIVTAVKLKAEGVRAGVWDMFLALPTKHYAGLFIEMKVGKNKLTKAQEEFGDKMTRQGYFCVVCYNLDQFMDAIESYLSR